MGNDPIPKVGKAIHIAGCVVVVGQKPNTSILLTAEDVLDVLPRNVRDGSCDGLKPLGTVEIRAQEGYRFESTRYASRAVAMLLMSFLALATLARICDSRKLGMAIAARMAIIATIIKSSMSVKPFRVFISSGSFWGGEMVDHVVMTPWVSGTGSLAFERLI